jgi:hypothetical protein
MLGRKDVTSVKGGPKGLMIWDSNPSRAGNFYLLQKPFRPAVGPTRPPIQWIPGVKRPGLEVNH